MSLTKPIVHVGEAPIDAAMISRILRSAPPQMILVGGQALAFWMTRYGVGPRVRRGREAASLVTTDADFIGDLDAARDLARALHGRVISLPRRALTALAAQVKLRSPSGLEHNIDVLSHLFDVGGLRASRAFTERVVRRAVTVELPESVRIRVMHPIDLLAARIQNVAGLAETKGPHTVTQARWAVRVARHALERAAAAPTEGTYRPGALAAEVLRLSFSRAGHAALRDHGIEAAAAIPFAALIENVSGFKRQARAMLHRLQANGRLTGMKIP